MVSIACGAGDKLPTLGPTDAIREAAPPATATDKPGAEIEPTNTLESTDISTPEPTATPEPSDTPRPTNTREPTATIKPIYSETAKTKSWSGTEQLLVTYTGRNFIKGAIKLCEKFPNLDRPHAHTLLYLYWPLILPL